MVSFALVTIVKLNVIQEEVDKVNKRSDTGSSTDNLCPHYSLRFQRSVVEFNQPSLFPS